MPVLKTRSQAVAMIADRRPSASPQANY